ncbi:MAG: hypothetical protein AAB395_01990 [Patescibacteria group bacterium]
MQEVQDQTWSEIPHVFVQGDHTAKSRKDDPRLESWKKIAVMRVNPTGSPFRPAFFNEINPVPQFCDEPWEDIEKFGMRVGPEDVYFAIFAAPDVGLELIGIYDINDPAVKNVVLF